MNFTRTFALLILFLGMLGCAAKTAAIHPGAADAFDSKAYDAIKVAQAALTEASKNIAAFPQQKPALNAALDSYNLAQAAYKSYHCAVVRTDVNCTASMISNAPSESTLQALLDSMLSLVAHLLPVVQ